jgi:antitoxin component of MazEF toxin-antitoxin module
MTSAVITKWGNSLALRIPSNMIKKMDLECNDKVYMEANENRIIISKVPAPKKGTLEYLFKDYSGESFTTTLINPTEPIGNEKW